MIQFGFRRFAAVLQIFIFTIACAVASSAADKTLIFSGVAITVQDVSADVDVIYSSMRLNRALNVWNVEVSIRNKSAEPIRGPVAFYIESFTGTTGACCRQSASSSAR